MAAFIAEEKWMIDLLAARFERAFFFFFHVILVAMIERYRGCEGQSEGGDLYAESSVGDYMTIESRRPLRANSSAWVRGFLKDHNSAGLLGGRKKAGGIQGKATMAYIVKGNDQSDCRKGESS